MTPRKSFFLILGLVSVIILGGGAGYYFADQYLSDEATQISSLKADNEILDLKIASARKAQSKLEELSFINKIADDVLPPTKIQSDLVGQILKLGEDSNIGIDDITFVSSGVETLNPDVTQTEPVEGIPGVNSLRMNLSFTGEYAEVINFLESLETSRRKMQVGNLTITPETDEDTGNTGNFLVQLIVNVYVRTDGDA